MLQTHGNGCLYRLQCYKARPMKYLVIIFGLFFAHASMAQAPVYYEDNDSYYNTQNYNWDSAIPQQAPAPVQGYAPIIDQGNYGYDAGRQVYTYQPQESYDPIVDNNSPNVQNNPYYYQDPYAIGSGVERNNEFYGDNDDYYAPSFDHDFYTR